MKTGKTFSVAADIAERGNFKICRYEVKDNRFILSESDIRNMVVAGIISPSEFHNIDIIEVNRDEAKRMIAENGHKINGEGGIPDLDDEEQESGSSSEETDDGEEAPEEEIPAKKTSNKK